MNDRRNSVFVCLTVFLAVACHASAQPPKAASTLLNGWDRNRNGLLERSEIPAEARIKIEAWAKREGLDPRRGLPIKRLLADDAKLRKRAKVSEEENEKDVSDSDSATEEVAAKQHKTSIGSSKKSKPVLPDSKDAQSGVMGFGDSGQSKRAKGFGTSRPREMSPAKPSPEKPSPEKQDEETRERKQLRVLAKSMMAQHDANKNGRLEKSEWSQLRGNPNTSDRNGDGVLTSEELANHLAGFAAREKERRAPRRSKVSPRSKKNSPRKTYRFLTPHERLPKGLPDWYTDKDLNEDGQLSLYEYAARLSQAKLNEFVAFDLNNDGFIVPKEYLKATE